MELTFLPMLNMLDEYIHILCRKISRRSMVWFSQHYRIWFRWWLQQCAWRWCLYCLQFLVSISESVLVILMELMCFSFMVTDCFPFTSNALTNGPNTQLLQYETASCYLKIDGANCKNGEKTQETNSKQSTVIMLSVKRSSIDGYDKMTESCKCIICSIFHCLIQWLGCLLFIQTLSLKISQC